MDRIESGGLAADEQPDFKDDSTIFMGHPIEESLLEREPAVNQQNRDMKQMKKMVQDLQT